MRVSKSSVVPKFCFKKNVSINVCVFFYITRNLQLKQIIIFFFFLVVSKQKIIIMFTYMLQMLGTVNLHMNHTIIYWSSPHLCCSKWNWHSQYHLHFSDTNLMCLNMSQSNFVTGDRHGRRKKMNNPPTLIMVLLSQPQTHFSGIYHLCRQQPTLLYHIIQCVLSLISPARKPPCRSLFK